MGCCTHLLSQLPANEEIPGHLRGKRILFRFQNTLFLVPLSAWLLLPCVRAIALAGAWLRHVEGERASTCKSGPSLRNWVILDFEVVSRRLAQNGAVG